jgi:uncharacterized protein
MASPNRLAKETSPYLLQHAHNPVDWFPWGEEALQKAKLEDKPILVSIGYSACHWCHVMERESFEDPVVAEIMNRGFVNIKIDREERPDLDHVYMDAVQALTGSGGWPLNVFLTPDGKPFYGGTYFPPVPAFNRPSWKQLLASIGGSFREKRSEIEEQSQNLTSHLVKSNAFGVGDSPNSSGDAAEIFNPENLQKIFGQVMESADRREGGFGRAPKFPQTFMIRFLLHYHFYSKDPGALAQACLSLDKMIRGGIYDQLGGGFARYSTDERWLVPHFEKMLYDNALLVSTIAEAYQITQAPHYQKAIKETMDFIASQWLSPEGGFYSALDADSEGVEGKYYVWERGEIENVLGPDSELFCAYYGVAVKGNWEGVSILHVAEAPEDFAKRRKIDPSVLDLLLERGRKKLLERRSKRKAPALDDKILLGWNALMITACCKAYSATGEPLYLELAEKNLSFIWSKFKGSGIYYFFHAYKDGQARFPAFLDDYAYLVEALRELQEVTGNSEYLQRAKEVAEFVARNFSEEDTGQFFFTHKDQTDIIIRKKEIYDGALPSGNAIMSLNLLYLSIIFDIPAWKARALHNCVALSDVIIRYPVSFGIWATMLQAVTYGMFEVVIMGAKPDGARREFLRNFIPNRVFQSAASENHLFPLLENKPLTNTALIYLCTNYSCQNPVTEVDELIRQLENVRK